MSLFHSAIFTFLLLIPATLTAQYNVEIEFPGYSSGDLAWVGSRVDIICRVTDENGTPVDLDTEFGDSLSLHPSLSLTNFQFLSTQPSGIVGERNYDVINILPDGELRACTLSYEVQQGEFVNIVSPVFSLTFAGPRLTIERSAPTFPQRAQVELDEPLEHFCLLVDPWGNPIQDQFLYLDRTVGSNNPWNWSGDETTSDETGRIRFITDVIPADVSNQIDPSSFGHRGISESLNCRTIFEREFSNPYQILSFPDSDLTWIPADSVNIDLTHSIPISINLTDTAEWSCLVRDEAGNPLVGKTIESTFAGGVNFSSTTDQNGVALFSWGPSSPDPIIAGFHRPYCRMADPVWPNFYWYLSHSVNGFTVEPDFDRVLTATPISQSAAIGEDVSWTCKIEDEKGMPLEGKTIIGSSSGSGVSDINGEVDFTLQAIYTNVPGKQVGETTELRCRHIDPVAAPGYQWLSEPININWTANPGTIVFDLKVFLDGPYADGEMSNELVDQVLIPHYQPYNQSPWFFETVNDPSQNRPSSARVDWIMVSLRTSAAASSEVARKAIVLNQDGTADDDFRNQFLTFDGLDPDPYFLVVEHRNHIPIMSAAPLVFNPSPECLARYCYDFSQQATYGIDAQRDLGNGVFGMWGGDGNRDSQITAFDFLNIWLPVNGGGSGYDFGDFDMNGVVTAFDFLQVWLPANGRSVQF